MAKGLQLRLALGGHSMVTSKVLSNATLIRRTLDNQLWFPNKRRINIPANGKPAEFWFQVLMLDRGSLEHCRPSVLLRASPISLPLPWAAIAHSSVDT